MTYLDWMFLVSLLSWSAAAGVVLYVVDRIVDEGIDWRWR